MKSDLSMKREIRRFYSLQRPVTSQELAAELANLRRKRANGSLVGTVSEILAIRLDLDREVGP